MKIQLGRYQSRSNRIVEITSSRMVDVREPGGTNRQVRVWSGTLMKANGKDVDSVQEFDDSGAFRNQRGVASPMDISILIEAAPVTEQPTPDAKPKASQDPRLNGHAEQLAERVALGTCGAADDLGILCVDDFSEDPDGAIEKLKANINWESWVELVAETVLQVLGAIEQSKSATKA